MSFNGYGQQVYGVNPWQANSLGTMGNLTVVDKVPQDMLYLVDSYWYKFPPS